MIEVCGKRKIYSATMVVGLKVLFCFFCLFFLLLLFFCFFFVEGVVDIKTVKIGV